MLKKTTGITGLAVAQNPRHTLLALYGKVLRVLSRMPDEAAYKKYTEEIIAHRMDIVDKNPCTEDIEQEIGCGQVEELILQAEKELRLARDFLRWQVWKPLENPPPPNQWTWPPQK